MKILVVGRGWTGKKVIEELNRRGHAVIACSHTVAFEVLTQDNYDWVINCAGITGSPNVDACERDPEGTLEGNTIFPIRLYHECEKQNIRFGHVSSGCIYQGVITDVNTKPNYFGSIYSISKGMSDSYLKERAQVYRIRMPFTNVNERKNYLTKVYNYAKHGKLIEGGANSLTDLNEATRIIAELVSTNQPNGYYNLVNSGSVTMHELVDMMGIQNPTWYTSDEFRAATVAGRSNCVIPSYHMMRPVWEALQDAIYNIHFQ